ncbi:MAG: hypothetical protein FWC32_02215, partial [Firmicutes bacterium]|nr:hypothetical protein [Bacillota bacterium]
MRKFLCKKVLLKKALAVVVSFAMLFGSFYLPGAVTRVAADWQPFNANLLANGDFSQGMTGWDSRWGGRVEPNTGQGGQNISDNMAVLGNRVSLSWNGMFSDVLTLTQGTYRLSAWARNLGPHGYPREALLGLVPNDGVGREEFNRYGYWTPEGAIQYWVTDEALRAAVPAIRPSVVCFNDAADWVYRSVEFVLCERLIRVFDNGQFRVAFRSWSSYGMYITGITLTKIDDGGGQFADKTALRAAIAAAQGHVQANYTPESWAVLADALSAAQTVYEYADASQLAVDAATEALLAAIAGLVPADTGGPIGPTPLSGTPFGNIPAYAYRAFDGNLDTYYVGGNSGYVGLDLGEGNYFRITGARIAPLYRTGNPWFGTHARSSLQGSVDGITFVTLGEFYTSDITAPTWFELSPVNNAELLAQTFRFFRLLGSQWHNFRVAEVEFFGYIPTPCLDCNLITCECCAVCGPPPCDCCDVCDSFPCVCPPCVTDRPPGTFGNQVYFNDFSANTAGGYYTYGNFRTGHGDKSRSTYAGQGYFLHFPASGGAGVTAAHYSGDTVLTEGNLYVLSITYRTNAQASARFVGVGAPDNPWMHWFDGVPGWAWNGIHVPVSANWTTAYMVFTAGASPNNYSPAILLGRQYGGIGHGTWDVSQITIHELHVDPADKAALASAIAAAEAITDQELYTPATWIAMQAALTTARAVYGNMLATQEAVDAAATALQNAINNLVERTLEDFRTLLNNLIIQGQGLNENDYTPATWAVFAAALANAQAVHGNSAATIPQIRAAMDALQAAINSLVPQQAAILLPNGDFSQNLTGWNGPSWNIAILPNSGLNALNTSANMARVTAGWNRFTSNVIIINEPGFYSLNAWGKAPGTGPNVHLFLTYEYHDGAPERDRDWRWDFVWEIPNMGGPEGSRVRPSVVNFSGLDDWTQLATVFEITQPLIDAHNGRFRVAFRTEGNTGPLYITGIRLVQVCDDCRIDPCLCDEVICRLALAQAIADAEAITGPALLYTPETWAALQTALATARTVYSNPFVVQAVIDNATNALQAAIDGLVPRTNAELRVLLGALIADAEGRNPSDYRAGTWNLVANALAAAQTVYGNAAATNIMLVNAYSALRAAINDLVPMPPELTIGENLFDDGFSRTTTPSVGGWTDPWRATIHPSDYAGKPSYNFITLTNNWSRMNKPIHLQGNVRYRFSAWVRGGGDGPTGVILTPLLGSPRPTGPCGSTLCHDTWCSCESFRIARLPVTTPVANWEFRSVEFVLEADVYAEVMLRSWPTGNPDGLSVSDIRIEVLEVFETYGVTFGAIGGGTVTAAIGLTPILHGAAVRPGTNVTFTANPAIGYTIDRWEVDGVVTNANNRTFTATVNADLDVRVFFIPAQGVVLTHGVQGGPGNVIARANGATTITSGTIAANGSVVPEGSSLAFFATPDAGYEVSHWIVNGSIVHLPGRLFTVAYLQGVGAVGALTFDVQVVFQEIDPTGGRFDPNSPRNTTYRGKMGININRDASQIISGSGLTAVFSDAFVASLAPFGLIRFMNYTNTNNHFTIHDWNAAEATLWGEVIALSNILNADIWVCIPVNASDAYIATLAALLEEHLNPNIVVYVEWGNEVWGFANQRLVNERMIQERGIPTDSRNIWVAHQLWWLWEHYFHFAQRTAEIAFIFRDAFNEDYRPIDVNSRIRPVLTWQVIPNAFAPMIEWLEGTTHTPFHSDPKFRNPHTYLWGVGIAPYFSEPNVAMANCVDHIHRHMLNSIEGWRPTLQAIINNADAAGFIGGAVTYEGG